MRINITQQEALDTITHSISPLGVEQVDLMVCLGRILAQDVLAPLDTPPFDRSPLDGYALRSSDTLGASQETPAYLQVVDTLYAGDVATVAVEPGQAVRIMTGAMLPWGCDCVVMQERTNLGHPTVAVYQQLRPHDNYCDQGEDYRQGDTLLQAGQVIDAAVIGVLCSAGITQNIAVYRQPSIAVLATGDEVVDPSVTPLPPGKIYGANAHLLWARLKELGFSQVDFAQIGDDPQAVADTLKTLCQTHDAVITTGGVSVGDKDIFHQALPLAGASQLFWRVQLKPGTPLMFSLLGGVPILSLSGNPFAAAATFELMARPLLAILASNPALPMDTTTGVLTHGFGKKSPGRRYLRGTYRHGQVTLPAAHASGQLSSFVGCNCLVDIPAGSEALQPGDTVTVRLL